jgi:acyl-coenzyme A thioesterase PaaI-like protein
MTDDPTENVLADGPPADGPPGPDWEAITDDGFVGHVGPFYWRDGADGPVFAFPTDARHTNHRGVLQGGALMTFVDRAFGLAVRRHMGRPYSATVQMDTAFAAPVRIGETVVTVPRIARAAGTLVFVQGTVTAGGRVVATAGGVWKALEK